MASDPHLRQVHQWLRFFASLAQRGPVSSLQLARVLPVGFTNLLAASQLARLAREKASSRTVFLTTTYRSSQGRSSNVRKPSRASILDPSVSVVA
jgi:hypothetical protein